MSSVGGQQVQVSQSPHNGQGNNTASIRGTTFLGKKVSCMGCIIGHRASGCLHAKDRDMYFVKAPGRPGAVCHHGACGYGCANLCCVHVTCNKTGRHKLAFEAGTQPDGVVQAQPANSHPTQPSTPVQVVAAGPSTPSAPSASQMPPADLSLQMQQSIMDQDPLLLDANMVGHNHLSLPTDNQQQQSGYAQQFQSMQQVQITQQFQPIQQYQPIYPYQPMQHFQTIQRRQPTQHFHSAQPTQHFQATQQCQTTRHLHPTRMISASQHPFHPQQGAYGHPSDTTVSPGYLTHPPSIEESYDQTIGQGTSLNIHCNYDGLPPMPPSSTSAPYAAAQYPVEYPPGPMIDASDIDLYDMVAEDTSAAPSSDYVFPNSEPIIDNGLADFEQLPLNTMDPAYMEDNTVDPVIPPLDFDFDSLDQEEYSFELPSSSLQSFTNSIDDAQPEYTANYPEAKTETDILST